MDGNWLDTFMNALPRRAVNSCCFYPIAPLTRSDRAPFSYSSIKDIRIIHVVRLFCLADTRKDEDDRKCRPSPESFMQCPERVARARYRDLGSVAPADR